MSISLTFLGTGTSTGIPALGCTCPVCRSTDIRDHRLRTSAFIEALGRRILIDCGPDFRTQALKAGITGLDAVLVTHHHYDHVGGTDDLRPFTREYPDGLPIYCKDDVARDFHRRMPYCFDEHPYPGVPKFDLRVIDREPFSVGGVEIIPLPVMHGSLDIRGFRIGPLAYITDCSSMPAGTLSLLQGTDTLVINALRHKPHPSHMNLREALDVINDVKPRRALLTHMSDGMGLHAETSPSLPHGVELAYDGLVVEIG